MKTLRRTSLSMRVSALERVDIDAYDLLPSLIRAAGLGRLTEAVSEWERRLARPLSAAVVRRAEAKAAQIHAFLAQLEAATNGTLLEKGAHKHD